MRKILEFTLTGTENVEFEFDGNGYKLKLADNYSSQEESDLVDMLKSCMANTTGEHSLMLGEFEIWRVHAKGNDGWNEIANICRLVWLFAFVNLSEMKLI